MFKENWFIFKSKRTVSPDWIGTDRNSFVEVFADFFFNLFGTIKNTNCFFIDGGKIVELFVVT